MDAKEIAARRAVEFVQSGMTVGLGTGSTATFAIRALSERIQSEGLVIRGVPSSDGSREQAESLHIPLTELTGLHAIDITIDGADEVDPHLSLIKGGGGALVREKLIAAASREVVIIVDEKKWHDSLGAFPLPVAVVPFGWQATLHRLEAFGNSALLRTTADGSPFVSNDGLYVVDIKLNGVTDAAKLERDIKQIVGVVEVGLFIGLATKVVIGYADGRSDIRLPPTGP